MKSVYAKGMHAVGRVLRKAGLLSDTPPLRERRFSHWAHSLTEVHDSQALVEMDVPWWTYGAIEAVEQWLAAKNRPVRVFEYGSGASTVWLARRADTVHSVEHHAQFASVLKSVLADYPNVDFRLVEADCSRAPAVPSRKEGYAGLDFTRYVDAINALDGTFDLIIIDGRAREACLAVSAPRLATGGLIVFDNSARRRYRTAIRTSGLEEERIRGLAPTLPYPEQTSLLHH